MRTDELVLVCTDSLTIPFGNVPILLLFPILSDEGGNKILKIPKDFIQSHVKPV